MRITPALLHKIARETVAQRARSDRSLLSVYLHGSLLEGNPLLGGTADIDLVFIHDASVTVEREIQRLTDEVHLDIAHHDRVAYHRTRDLRIHPWLGPNIINCKIMFDPQHFMDFTQASVRGQFDQPEHVYERAAGQANHARQIWLELHAVVKDAGVEEVGQYLRATEHAVNAVASLSGLPLTERRLLMNFPKRAEAAGRPGLYAGLLGLLGGPQADPARLQGWLPAWEVAYKAIPVEKAPPRLHPDRFSYYRRAFDALLKSDHPQNVLWPLLNTWTRAVRLLPEDSQHRLVWHEALQELALTGTGFADRVAALDAYLDSVEEILDSFAQKSGIEEL